MLEATRVFSNFNLIYKQTIKHFLKLESNITLNEISSLIDIYQHNNQSIQEIAKIGLHMIDSLIYNINILKKKECINIQANNSNIKSEINITPAGIKIINNINKKFNKPNKQEQLKLLQNKFLEMEILLNQIFEAK